MPKLNHFMFHLKGEKASGEGLKISLEIFEQNLEFDKRFLFKKNTFSVMVRRDLGLKPKHSIDIFVDLCSKPSSMSISSGKSDKPRLLIKANTGDNLTSWRQE